jgi:hypothetical protein
MQHSGHKYVELIQMHLEQPQRRFTTKRKIERFLSHSLRNLNACEILKEEVKHIKYLASHVLTKAFKTIPFSDDSNPVTQSL